MDYSLYRVLHLAAIFFVFAALGGQVLAHYSGSLSDRARKLAAMTHGIGLFVVLFAGFGLLKHVGLPHNPGAWPAWVWGKFAIWFLLGGLMVAVRKKSSLATLFWWGFPLLGAVAAYLAIYKP